MTPNVPISETGTATPGISVARTLRRKRKTTRITSETEMASVISTSRTDARIVVVRSIMTDRSIACGMDAFSAGSASLDAVHRVNHVRLRLLEDHQEHAGLAVGEAGRANVFAPNPRRRRSPKA